MSQAPVDGASDTRDRLIQLNDATPAAYFSRQVGRDYGSPTGGWTSDRKKATRFTEAEAAELLSEEGALRSFGANARVVPL